MNRAGSAPGWPALNTARAHDTRSRLPFVVNGARLGSVARAHLRALRAWPQWLRIDAAAVSMQGDGAALQAALAQINAALRAQGLILAWRDERFALFDPATMAQLGAMERAAARFWGTLTLGAHATGYVADAQGRPAQLWIAQRSMSKATDPGKFDNLVGGGVPDGQSPRQTLQREGWEEAGLTSEQMHRATAGSVLRLQRDIPEGLQHEYLHSYDLALPQGLRPHNQDGEVAGFECLPLPEALALARSGAMTVDAALVTLDFALRHRLLPATEMRRLLPPLQALRSETRVQAD